MLSLRLNLLGLYRILFRKYPIRIYLKALIIEYKFLHSYNAHNICTLFDEHD
jgi:hypothetical protein